MNRFQEVPLNGHRDKYFLERCLFLFVALISLYCCWLNNGQDTHAFLWGANDGLGYYQWLPAMLVNGKVDWMYWCHRVSEDKAVSLYSSGVAWLELPFYGLSQLATWFFDYPNDGFSPPNAVAMMVSTACYAGAGTVLTYRLARRFSDAQSALLAAVTLFASTNLFFYCTREPLMSHVHSFFLIALLSYCTMQVVDGRPRGWQVTALFVSAALMVLVRLLDVIVLLFPIWMSVTAPGGARAVWRTLGHHRKAALLGMALGLVPWVLQVAYWYHITGDLFVDGYALKNEHFDLSRMVPGMVMFSVRDGWLVYTPVLIAPVLMLLVQAWRGTVAARPVLLVVTLTMLIYSAWWCWWMGAGYGHRGMVGLYALMGIPLAWCFRWVLARSWTARGVAALLLIAFTWLNIELMVPWRYYWCDEGWTWPKLFTEIGNLIGGWPAP